MSKLSYYFSRSYFNKKTIIAQAYLIITIIKLRPNDTNISVSYLKRSSYIVLFFQ